MPDKLPTKKRPKSANLAQRYEYRSKHRSTVEGMASEALAGDRHCLKHLAAFGQILMEQSWKQGGNLAEAAWWLAGIMGEISNGKSPNQAFGYEQGPGARDQFRWKQEDFGKLQRQWMLAHHVAALVDGFKGKSYDDAVAIVCKAWSVPQNEAAAAMSSVAQGHKKISASIAKELALDVVEGLGAGSERASRSTIAQAYADYIRQD